MVQAATGGRATYTPTELADALRKLEDPKVWTRDLRRGYRKVGTQAAKWARDSMRSGVRDASPRRMARAAKAIRGSSTATAATLSMGGKSEPSALATIYGTGRPTGWNAGWWKGERRPRALGRPNNPGWVGKNWTVATKGSGPRGVNDSLAENQDRLVDMFGQAAMEITERAFPRGLR